MTGVGGRPEIIVEGSNDMDKGWKEYEFLYKPGNMSRILPVVGMSNFTYYKILRFNLYWNFKFIYLLDILPS
jgi:hypothetical protein